jgi:hypothetical protein
MADTERYLKARGHSMGNFETMETFCRCIHKWNTWLHFIGHYTPNSYFDIEGQRILVSICNLADMINRENDIELICTSILVDWENIATDIKKHSYKWEKCLQDHNPDSLAPPYTVRNLWKIDDHEYQNIEIPHVNFYAVKDEDGNVKYGDGEDLHNRTLWELTRITGGKLLRMYNSLVDKMDELAQMAIYLERAQDRFNRSSNTVNTIYNQRIECYG